MHSNTMWLRDNVVEGGVWPLQGQLSLRQSSGQVLWWFRSPERQDWTGLGNSGPQNPDPYLPSGKFGFLQSFRRYYFSKLVRKSGAFGSHLDWLPRQSFLSLNLRSPTLSTLSTLGTKQNSSEQLFSFCACQTQGTSIVIYFWQPLGGR